jgi:hypothetical protein
VISGFRRGLSVRSGDMSSRIQEISTFLMGAGRVDDGLTVADLETEVLRLRGIVRSTKPVCPHCGHVMEPKEFHGYYDAFSYWWCLCDSLPGASIVKGAFS